MHTVSWIMTVLVFLLCAIGLALNLPSLLLSMSSQSSHAGLFRVWITVTRIGLLISAVLHGMALISSEHNVTDLWSSITYACFLLILIPGRRVRNGKKNAASEVQQAQAGKSGNSG